MAETPLEKHVMASLLPAGYTARPVTMEDAESIADLCNAYSTAIIGQDTTTAEEMQVEWSFPGFDMANNTRAVFAPDGQVAGYMDIWDASHPARIDASGYVHPNHSGLGIASHLIEWAEARARESIPKAPVGARVVLLNHILSADDSARRLLGDLGYEAVRHFFRMTIRFDGPPPAPAWPRGTRVRTFVRDQDEWPTIHAVNETFKDHWGHVEESPEEEYDRWMYWINEDPDFDPTLWFLAMDGDDIAGVALCWLRDFTAQDMGDVMVLGVRRPWRRRGLELALLTHAFGEFHQRGQAGAILVVDADSLTGATRLYEKVGMHISRQNTIFEKELRSGEDPSTQSLD
jgi:mycothiol synthase